MRTIIENTSFLEARDKLGLDWDQMELILGDEGVGLLLARRPELGTHTAKGVYVYVTRAWPGAPRLAIYYKFSDIRVVLIDMVYGDKRPNDPPL